MFYKWLGIALWGIERYRDSYQYLHKALSLGEEINDHQVIGYACSWLPWTCAEIGLLDEAIAFGEKGIEIFMTNRLDDFVYFSSLEGMGYAYYHRGDSKKAIEIGKALLDYGQKYSNIRSLVYSQFVMGLGHFIAGDLSSAIECSQSAIRASADPYFSQFPRVTLVYGYVASGRFEEAEEPLQELLSYSEKFDVGIVKTPAQALQGLLLIAKGHMSQGVKRFEEIQRIWLETQRECLYAASENMLGRVYSDISRGGKKASLALIVKNAGFLLRNLPVAGRKAEEHFTKSIRVGEKIGAKGIVGKSYLDLGLLHKAKGRTVQAKEYLSRAVHVFEQCEAETYLSQAKEGLASLE